MFSKLEGQTAAIRPRLKRDSVGISVVPSIHKPKEVTTMSARSRRMVSKVVIELICSFIMDSYCSFLPLGAERDHFCHKN